MPQRKMTVRRRGQPKVTAWSYSTLSQYETCPAKVRYEKIEKHPTQKGQALLRGIRVHQHGEDYLSAARKPKAPPATFGALGEELEMLRKQKAVAEMDLAFTEGFAAVTTWVGPDTWARMKIDAFVEKAKGARVIDFKTGKIRDTHADQLSLYALGIFIAFPKVKSLVTEAWYVDHDELHEREFTRDELDALRKEWTEKPAALLADRVFEPRANPLCKWCDFHPSKGGPCDVGK